MKKQFLLLKKNIFVLPTFTYIHTCIHRWYLQPCIEKTKRTGCCYIGYVVFFQIEEDPFVIFQRPERFLFACLFFLFYSTRLCCLRLCRRSSFSRFSKVFIFSFLKLLFSKLIIFILITYRNNDILLAKRKRFRFLL